MARKYGSESSAESSDSEKRYKHKRDDRRGERLRGDKDRERANDKDLLYSDKRSRSRLDRREERRGDDKDRGRVNEKGVRDRDGRWRSEHLEQNESRQSSEEDGEWVEKERGKQEREKAHQHEGYRRRETGELGNVKESHQSYDENDELVEREKRKRERHGRHEQGHRQQETENGRRKRDRHARHDSGDDSDREERRKSEQRKDRTEQQKDSRRFKEKERDGKEVEDPKIQRQPRLQEGNINADASNLGKSGGVYIPPFKLARMIKEVEDKSSVEYQRLTWDALRKSINGLVNKVNAANIKNIIPELFSENLIRGRGLFCRSCMKSQMASPGFTDVFAALVAVVNTKFPEVGDLLLRRIVLQLKRAYKRNDKVCICLHSKSYFDTFLADGKLFSL